MTLINWVEIGQVDLKNICEKQNYNVRRLKLPWPAKYLKETPLCNVSSKLAIKHKDICDDTNHDFFISDIYKMRHPCQVTVIVLHSVIHGKTKFSVNIKHL